MANTYLTDILYNQDQQRRVTGRAAFSPSTVEAATKGDIDARYNAEAQSQQLALQQRGLAVSEKSQAAQESQYATSLAQQKSQYDTSLASQQSEFGQSLANTKSEFATTAAYNQDALSAEKSTGAMNSIVSGVGSVGTLALGASAASKEGLFGAGKLSGLFGNSTSVTPAVGEAAAAVPAYTATGAGAGAYSAAEGAGIAAGEYGAMTAAEIAAIEGGGAAAAGTGAAAGLGTAAAEIGAAGAGATTAVVGAVLALVVTGIMAFFGLGGFAKDEMSGDQQARQTADIDAETARKQPAADAWNAKHGIAPGAEGAKANAMTQNPQTGEWEYTPRAPDASF